MLRFGQGALRKADRTFSNMTSRLNRPPCGAVWRYSR
jgi:hypothetical protein